MDTLCEEDIVPLSTPRETAAGLLRVDESSPWTVVGRAWCSQASH